MNLIGVIADDLTGAAELGAVGWRHGLAAEVLATNQLRRKSGLVCIDTHSRSLPPKPAAARAAAAAKALRTTGVHWIFKKTDSVLRGQVTAEIEAIMRQFGCLRALLLPANPSLGRTIRNGNYYIGNRPLNRTDFARDPEHPRRSAKVVNLVAHSARMPLRVLKLSEDFSETGIHLGEVSSPEDTMSWIQRLEPDMLLAGGAETFGAVLRARDFRPAQPGGTVPPANHKELFVCGSASDACRQFIANSRRGGVPVFGLPAALATGGRLSRTACHAVVDRVTAALQTDPRVILSVGLPPVSDRSVAGRLSAHLAKFTAEVLRATPVDHVYAEGGETAAALLTEMGWERLPVKCELAPGVATLQPVGVRTQLTIKPGSYLWPGSVSQAVARRRHQTQTH